MGKQRQVVTIDDFSGGDSGRQRPAFNDLTKYRTRNTWVYPNGAIGPRPPWVPITITNTPVDKSLQVFNVQLCVNGVLIVWAFDDGDVYASDANSFDAQLATTQALGSNGYTDSVATGDNILIITDDDTDDGVHVAADGTATLIPTMPAGFAIEQYSEQTVIMRNPLPSGTPFLLFSDPRDFTTWDPANSVFIGSEGQCHNLYVQKDQLVIPRTRVGEVWVFTGVLGANEFLRRMDVGVAPAAPQLAEGFVTSSSLLMYTTGRTVSMFTGAQLVQEERPDLPIVVGYDTDPQYDNAGRIVGLDDDEQFIITGTFDQIADAEFKQVWMQSYSPKAGWHRHVVPITPYRVSDSVLGASSSKDSARAFMVAPLGASGAVYGVTTSDATVTGTSSLNHFSFYARQEAPYLPPGKLLAGGVGVGLTSVKDGDSGLPVTAEWEGPEVWAENNMQVAVRSVVIDYMYDTDSRICDNLAPGTVTNQFEISVRTLQPEDGTVLSTSTFQLFTPQASGLGFAVDGGTMKRGRQTFMMGEQGAGGGFQVLLTNWRGIMIKQITIHYDTEPARV